MILIVAASSDNGWICPAAGFALILVVAYQVAYGKPRTCGICGGPVKRTWYRVKVDGRRVKACGNCGSRILRRQSRRAVDQLLGED